jgi:hypothetical protein
VALGQREVGERVLGKYSQYLIADSIKKPGMPGFFIFVNQAPVRPIVLLIRGGK